MPTYEYRCPEGHEFEVLQKMSDPPEARCPECGKTAERQLSGGAGLLFKGSGFYITDYRSDAYKKAAASESGDAGKKADEKAGAPKKDGAAGGGSASSKPSSAGGGTHAGDA